MKERGRPSWGMFWGVSLFAAVGVAVWLGLLAFGSSFAGWSDGSGVYASHYFRDRLPLLAFALLALGFLPPLSRAASLVSLALAFAVHAAFVFVVLWRDVGVMGLLFGAVVEAPFVLLRWPIGKKEPIQASETTRWK